jgi:hypothetical protein
MVCHSAAIPYINVSKIFGTDAYRNRLGAYRPIGHPQFDSMNPPSFKDLDPKNIPEL